MLGVIHRSVMGEGPEQVQKYFILAGASEHPRGRSALRRHCCQLESYRVGKFLDVASHSILGLVDVYNLLPPDVVNVRCVHKFQGMLQDIIKKRALRGDFDWENTLSPRLPLHLHPLREFIASSAGDCSVELPVDERAAPMIMPRAVDADLPPSWICRRS